MHFFRKFFRKIAAEMHIHLLFLRGPAVEDLVFDPDDLVDRIFEKFLTVFGEKNAGIPAGTWL